VGPCPAHASSSSDARLSRVRGSLVVRAQAFCCETAYVLTYSFSPFVLFTFHCHEPGRAWRFVSDSVSVAATSVDPGIYSGAPFAFKADRGIFSEVPEQQVDAHIFSPISDLSDMHVRKHFEERSRLRHDL
jgi:hypothetical protein